MVPCAIAPEADFSTELLARQRPRQLQCLAELGRILAARLSHRRPAAAAAADYLGNLADQLAGVDAFLHQVITRRRDQVDLAVVRPADYDDGTAGLLLE